MRGRVRIGQGDEGRGRGGNEGMERVRGRERIGYSLTGLCNN